MPIAEEPLTVDYLAAGAPECPMVRLYGTQPKKFRAFHDLVESLAGDGEQHTRYRLRPRDDGGGIVACALTLMASPQSLGISHWSKDESFDWVLTRADWATVAALTEPFVSAFALGRHQWLAGPHAPALARFGTIGVLLSASADGTW